MFRCQKFNLYFILLQKVACFKKFATKIIKNWSIQLWKLKKQWLTSKQKNKFLRDKVFSKNKQVAITLVFNHTKLVLRNLQKTETILWHRVLLNPPTTDPPTTYPPINRPTDHPPTDPPTQNSLTHWQDSISQTW